MNCSEKARKVFAGLRLAYMLLYLVILICTALIPFRRATDGHMDFAYGTLEIVGIALLCVNLLKFRTACSGKNAMLPALFIAVVLLSSLVNIRFGFVENVTVTAWMCIQFFLLAAVDVHLSPEVHRKHLRILSEVFCLLWTVGVLWSLQQFVVQYEATWRLLYVERPTHEGFFDGRLYGVFTDPNFASLCSLAAIVFCGIHLNGDRRSIPCRVYHIVLIVLQAIYIVLAGSRTALVAAAIAGALRCAFAGWCWVERHGKQAALRLATALAGSILFVAVLIGGVQLTRTVAAYVPGIHCAWQNPGTIALEGNQGNRMIPFPTVSFDRSDVSPSRDISNNRFRIWSDYFHVFLTSPVLGTSPANVHAYTEHHFDDLFVLKKNYSVHNGYLALLVCTGIAGAVCMLVWLLRNALQVLRYLIRRRNAQDVLFQTVLHLSTLLCIFAIGAFSLQYLFFSNTLIDLLFWSVFGYTTALIRSSQPEAQASASLPLCLSPRIRARISCLRNRDGKKQH